MPQFGPPDQRDRSRNRRTRRRGGTGQIMRGAPVTEYDEAAELEAARERNDLDVSDLREMSVNELRQVSRELELETGTQERKEDLVERILERQTERAGLDYASGILDIVDEGFVFLRRHGLLPGPDDAYVSSSQVRRFGLRIGNRVSGSVRAPREGEKYWGLLRVDWVNGVDSDPARRRDQFGDLTPVHPDVLINLESDSKNLSQRMINLVNPIGKGQRALIVSPPKAGKTMLLKHIANGVSTNYPEVLLMVALIGERPEEVTDMRRSVKGEVISSTFDEPTENHTHVAEMALEIAKRQVETGRDVVILLDSITRLVGPWGGPEGEVRHGQREGPGRHTEAGDVVPPHRPTDYRQHHPVPRDADEEPRLLAENLSGLAGEGRRRRCRVAMRLIGFRLP